MTPLDVELLSKVKRGRQRRIVLSCMDARPLMVSEIQRKTNECIRVAGEGKKIRLSDVSRTLRDLLGMRLVKCLNPSKRGGDKGILYQLTPLGKKTTKLL